VGTNGKTAPDVAPLMHVLPGNGDGTFGQAVDTITAFRPLYLDVGDVNGDGKLDLVYADNNDESIVGVLLGNGNDTFRQDGSYMTGQFPSQVLLRDLDGDGKLDIATPNLKGDGVRVFLGAGDGTFSVAQDFSTGTNSFPDSIAAGDFNGDG